MIRKYKDGDLEKLEPNEYVDLDLFGERLKDILDNYETSILEEKEENIAIISFREYTAFCYTAFFICSKKITAKHMHDIRNFVQGLIKDFSVKRVETLCLNNKAINSMMLYLGFTLEGTKRKFFKDTDYNMWGYVNGL